MKFKVWDKDHKKWDDETEFALNSEGKLIGLFGSVWDTVDSCYVPIYSTETNDKNGIELFDGDIIPGGVKGVNVMLVYDANEFPGWKTEYLNGKCKGLRICAHVNLLKNSIKIGNKFENPELLET